ncbi:unnamed protein product, partial [marine sediment metagenome]
MRNPTVIADKTIRTAQKPQNLRQRQIRQASRNTVYILDCRIAESVQLSRPQQEYHLDISRTKLFGYSQKIIKVPAFMQSAAAR